MTNLERELDVLFQAPFAEFVGTRNGLATRLKKEGRDAEAARVRGLAKPTYTAWLVNQLYWGARLEFDVFLKAADRVRAAEKAMLEGRRPGAAHAGAVDDRRAALDALVAKATSRAAEEGTPLSPALTERLRVTLDAIGAHGTSAARHARGRLQEDLDPPGFAAFAALANGTIPAKKSSTPAAVIPMPVRPAPNPRLNDARAKIQAARGDAARQQDALAAATDAERRAKTALDQAKTRLAEADRALKSAQAEVDAAQAALKSRQAELREASRAAAASDKALERASEHLRKLE
jgi:hypothetical protein